MTAQQEPAEARLDDLRRRLYRAGATDADLRRYLAEQEAVVPEPAPVATPHRPRRGRVAIGVALVAVAAGALLVAIRPEASPGARPVRMDVGDGRILTVDGTAGAPVPVPAVIAGTAVTGARFQGYGSAVVAVDPPQDALDGGRAQIAVTSTDPADVSWRALIVVSRLDESSFPVMAAQGVAEERSGAHAATTFVYPNRPPTRIAVDAPEGVGWTLVVALTGRIAAAAR